MADPAGDLLFELGYRDAQAPGGLLADYWRHVANGGLRRYKGIFQSGAKAGEPVYVHFLNGVLTAERIRPLVGLSDTETRVLYSAYSVHDLNKVAAQGAPVAFNTLAEPGRVAAELRSVGIPGFFPDYLNYIEDITLLVRQHSAHHAVGAELLVVNRNPYRLPRARLADHLVPLMRALDLLGLSTTLEEADHKAACLAQLNRIAPRRYAWVRHRVSEQRGLLTNVMHNAVVDCLGERFGLIPVAFYPEGVAYLAEAETLRDPEPDDHAALGAAVSLACSAKSRRDFAKFVRSGPSGIVVGQECLQVGVGFPEIFGAMYNIVAGRLASRAFKPEELEAKVRGSLAAARAKHPTHAATIGARLAHDHVVPPTQEGMAAGELLRAYAIFLGDHAGDRLPRPWPHLYGLLGIDGGAAAGYEPIDARYQRAYVLAHDLDLDLDAVAALLLHDGRDLFPPDPDAEAVEGDFAAMAAYTASALHLDFGRPEPVDFTSALRQYTAANHRQCCACGSEHPTGRWMARQVPPNVTVQSFSNRLPGGTAAEPKRNVCAVCRVQFTLEKLAHRSLKGIQTTFVFLFPHTYFPGAYIQGIRDQVTGLLAQDCSVLFPQTDAAIRDAIEEQRIELPLRMRNPQGKPYQYGMVLPQYPETIGNVLVFPLNCPGNSEAERFLFALQNALLLQRYFGCRAAVGHTPVPSLGAREFADLFIDGVPLGFGGLVPVPDLARDAIERLWADIGTLHRARRLLYNPERQENVLLTLIRALETERRLGLFLAADRLIEHRAAQGRADRGLAAARASGLARQVLPLIRELRKGEEPMEALEHLAAMAWEGHIIGRSLERNALLKPFDLILEALDNQSPAFGEDTVRAQLVEDIFRHLEAIAREGFRPGRTKREKVKGYVGQFFDGVLHGVYGGSATRLLADKRQLRSAYLFYLSEQIPARPAAQA